MPARSHILAGNESLLVHCGNALLDAGDSVAAVVTDTPEIAAWAESRQLRIFSGLDELGDAPELSFDFILSIGNLKIIAPAILRRAGIGGINFHDGPLPELGGLNTPAWAIMRGNAEHGVTWHWMTGAVDAGAIIAERRFRIAADETALTLNARCFDAAIEFSPRRDCSDSIIRHRPRQSGRCEAARADPRGNATCGCGGAGLAPASGGALGPGSGTRLWPVRQPALPCQGGDCRSAIGGAAAAGAGALLGCSPGTLLAIADDGLTVATGSEDVRIPRFRTLAGEALSAREAALRFNLREGDILRLPESLSASISAIDARVAAHEGWWIRRLVHCEPGTLRFLSAATRQTAAWNHCRSTSPPFPSFRVMPLRMWPSRSLPDCSRDCVDGQSSVTYEGPALRSLIQEVKGWYAGAVPVRLSVPFEGHLGELVEMVERDLSAVPSPTYLFGRPRPAAADAAAHTGGDADRTRGGSRP